MTAVAAIAHVRGETITFGLRSASYDGTETLTCDIKVSINGTQVPPETAIVVTSVIPQFVAGDPAHYLFTIPANVSAGLTANNYITDAKVVYADGSVDYPLPLAIQLSGRVTV